MNTPNSLSENQTAMPRRNSALKSVAQIAAVLACTAAAADAQANGTGDTCEVKKVSRAEGAINATVNLSLSDAVCDDKGGKAAKADTKKSEADGKTGAKKTAAKPAEPERNLKLLQPLDPKTYYVASTANRTILAEGAPMGFEVVQDNVFSFHVTGPATVALHIYPRVPAEKTMSLRVKFMGRTYDISPNTLLTKGETAPGTEKTSGGTTTVRLKNSWKITDINVPAGTHDLTVLSTSHDFVVQLISVDETGAPGVEPALDPPFEEDPDTPPSFRFPCRIDEEPDAASGYAFRELTPSPLGLRAPGGTEGLEISIERFRDSALATVHLEDGKPGKDDFVRYSLRKPLSPDTSSMCEFERVIPPATSTDWNGPTEIPVNIKVSGTAGAYTAEFPPNEPGNAVLPGTFTKCQVNNVARSNPKRAHVTCWENTVESRVRAHRATLDTRTTTPPVTRKHKLKIY